jgi:hypothetical protein
VKFAATDFNSALSNCRDCVTMLSQYISIYDPTGNGQYSISNLIQADKVIYTVTNMYFRYSNYINEVNVSLS